MENNELFELMSRFERSNLQFMKLKDGDFALELQKAQPVIPVAYSAAPAAAITTAAPIAAPAVQEEAQGEFVRAPLVGTFYAAAAPGEPPFASVGARIEKGQTLCLIEAMKTMSEIPAPCDLIVEEVLAENGTLVAFDAPILRYRHV